MVDGCSGQRHGCRCGSSFGQASFHFNFPQAQIAGSTSAQWAPQIWQIVGGLPTSQNYFLVTKKMKTLRLLTVQNFYYRLKWKFHGNIWYLQSINAQYAAVSHIQEMNAPLFRMTAWEFLNCDSHSSLEYRFAAWFPSVQLQYSKILKNAGVMSPVSVLPSCWTVNLPRPLVHLAR